MEIHRVTVAGEACTPLVLSREATCSFHVAFCPAPSPDLTPTGANKQQKETGLEGGRWWVTAGRGAGPAGEQAAQNEVLGPFSPLSVWSLRGQGPTHVQPRPPRSLTCAPQCATPRAWYGTLPGQKPSRSSGRGTSSATSVRCCAASGWTGSRRSAHRPRTRTARGRPPPSPRARGHRGSPPVGAGLRRPLLQGHWGQGPRLRALQTPGRWSPSGTVPRGSAAAWDG